MNATGRDGMRYSAMIASLLMLGGCVGYGNSGGGYGDGNGNGYGYRNARTVRCESNDKLTEHCKADTSGGVRLARQLSDTSCEQGRNWGYDNGGIWVAEGCRAEFVVGAGNSGDASGHGSGQGTGYRAGQTLRCESNDNRQQRCKVAVGSGVDLVRQISDTRCVQGQNWGWDNNGIWVSAGCRAEFRIR